MTRIKNISLLLSRFGPGTDYDCVLYLYRATDYGIPVGTPLGMVEKSAADIDFKDYYNFIFDPVVQVDEGTNLAIVFHQTSNDGNNYIVWHESKQLETASGDGYALDTNVQAGDIYGFDYGYLYGLGYGFPEGPAPDYFNLFFLDSANEGYALGEDGGYGYGFERTLWQSNPFVKRCFKVYDEFNEFINDGDNVYFTVPGAQSKTLSFSNRAELYDGFKKGVSLTDDRVTLKDLGKRVAYYDTNDDEPRWWATNRNLPPSVSHISINSKSSDGSENAYNCCMLATTSEGLFYSTNSGGDWVKFEHPELNDAVVISTWFEANSGQSFWVAYQDSGSVYKVSNFSEFVSPSLVETQSFSDEITCGIANSFYSSNEAVLVGTVNGLYFRDGSLAGLEGYTINGLWQEGLLSEDIYILTKDAPYGVYVLNGGILTPLDGTDDPKLIPTRAFIIFNSKDKDDTTYDTYYIGSDSGTYARTASESVFVGNDPQQTPYLSNLKRTATMGFAKEIDTQNNLDATLFVAQDSGVSKSKSGIDFETITEELYPDTDVKQVLVNPVDNRLIHISCLTTKNKTPYVTFVVDKSGSMYTRSSDGESDQYKLLSDIGDTINSAYLEQIDKSASDVPGMRFQLIEFATDESDVVDLQSIYDRSGAVNVTEGFVPWSTPSLQTYWRDTVTSINTEEHARTPLYETLYATLLGLYNEGSNWTYRDDLQKYVHESNTDPLFSSSARIMILVTDGRDTASMKSLSFVLNSSSFVAALNKLDVKLYIIAYGEQADLSTLSQLKISNAELLYARSGSVTDFTTIKNYILGKEQYRYRDGIYRKSIYLDEEVIFETIETDLKIPADTAIQIRYRTSSNKYDLGDFSDYQSAVEGTTTITVNSTGRFLEVEFLMSSNYINNSPSVMGLSVTYKEPSKSTLILSSFDNASSNRIDQFHFTTNIFTEQYGYDYLGRPDLMFSHFLNPVGYDLPINFGLKFSPTSSFQDENFELAEIDKRSIVDRRVKEKTTTTNQMVYTLVNGAWDSTQNETVYVNDKAIDETSYYITPSQGQIIFPTERKTSDIVTVTIDPRDTYRMALDIRNPNPERQIKLEDFALEYLSESGTVNSRGAIPLTPSQIPANSSSVLTYRSNVNGNETAAIAGEPVYITATFFVTEDIQIGQKLLIGLGDFYELPDETLVFQPHENKGVFSPLQFSPDLSNSIFIQAGVTLGSTIGLQTTFALESVLDNRYILARVERAHLKRGTQVFIYIGGQTLQSPGFNTKMTRADETEHSQTTGVVGGITTYLAVATGESTAKPEEMIANFKPALPPIEVGSTKDAGFVHVACPMTPETKTIPVIMTITDNKGIVAHKATPTVVVSIKNLALGTETEVGTYTFSSSDGGTKKITANVTDNGYYQVFVRIGFNVFRSGIIHVGATSRILWGDLNAKSTLGHGRQSPNFVYEYARDRAGIDFCAIADDANLMTEAKWEDVQEITEFYNVEGEFITYTASEWRQDASQQSYGFKSLIFKDQNIPTIDKIKVGTISALYNNLALYDVITYAQHPAYSSENIKVRDRNVNWQTNLPIVNTGLEKAVELYSEHGSSEAFATKNDNPLSYPATSGAQSYVTDALALGYKLSFLGTSNSATSRPGLYTGELARGNEGVLPSATIGTSEINNRGLTAVLATSFSRNAIFEAIKNGRTYATTGARIHIGFKLGQFSLGDTVTVTERRVNGNLQLDQNPTFTISVKPTSDSATVTLVRVVVGGSVFEPLVTRTFLPNTEPVIFEDTTLISERKNAAYYVRVVQNDKHIAWTSPIYVQYNRLG